MAKQINILQKTTPICLLVISVLIFFSGVLFSGKSLLGSDFILQFYPWKNFIYEHVRSQGALPFWNPYLFSGTPFISNIQASMFYPLGFIYYFFPPEPAYLASTILHCILGSIFMYILMRSVAVSTMGSFLSAFLFTFNGYFVAHLYAGHLSFVQNYIWIPLIFLLWHRFIQKGAFKYAVMTGLVLGVQILGGFPQIAFYSILIVLSYGLYHAAVILRKRAYREISRLACGFAVILCIGFSLSAVQTLPTLEFMQLSTRAGGVNYAFATYDSLHPKELIPLLIPDIFGNPVDQTYWRTSEVWHFWETCGYAGIMPFFLLFFSFRNHNSIRHLRLFFMLLIFLSLFLALGKYNPAYSLVYHLPGFNSFRIPAQILFIYMFGVAVLSGIGLFKLSEENWSWPKGFKVVVFLLGMILLFLLASLHYFHSGFFRFLFQYFSEGPIKGINFENLYGRIRFSIDRTCFFFFGATLLLIMRKNGWLNRQVFKMLAIILLMADLGLFSIQFIKPYELNISQDKERIISRLGKDPFKERTIAISSLFLPNDGLTYQIPSILGYDPLILRKYLYYIQWSQGYPQEDHVVNLGRIKDPYAKLLKLLNVGKLIYNNRIVDVKNEIPYAHIVHEALRMPSGEMLSYMKTKRFDPAKIVLLEPGSPLKDIPNKRNKPFTASCSVLSYDIERIHIKTSSNRSGYLVLSEIYYPGWQAYVDGKRAVMLKGNYLFRVIPLEKGEHEVRLHFISWPFRIGAVISLFSLICSVIFLFITHFRKSSL